MAASSVAFLAQVEYEAALDSIAEEHKRQEQEQEFELTRTGSYTNAGNSRSLSGQIRAAAVVNAQERRRDFLQRTALRGQDHNKKHGRDKESEISAWISQQQPNHAALGPPRGAHFDSPSAQRRSSPLRHSASSAKLRRSNSVAGGALEVPSLWYRVTHVDVRGLTDSVLPILNPDTRGKRLWDLLIMSLVVYTAITVPLSVSYGMPQTEEWTALNQVIVGLFALDLLVSFRTAFYSHQGELVRDSSAVAKQYMKMWFWIDLFGTIPFDSIVMWTGALSGAGDNSTTLAALGFLKAPRLLRLGRLLRFLDQFKNAKIFRIAQLFMAMILISHWLACVWYMMYRFGGKDQADDWTFIIIDDHEPGSSLLDYYVINYYQCFLLLVGDNIPAYNNFERTFMIVVLVMGTFFYSAVVGQMATLVATMNVAVNRHGQKLLMVQDALRYAGVPDKFREKVQEYFEYLQQKSHPGAEGMQFLQELPVSLNQCLSKFLHKRNLSKIPLFQDCEEGFVSALTMRIRMISLGPGEIIFRDGDVGREMYIIKKGCVAVTTGNGQMVALLPPGEIFGEVALLSTGKRTANCTALGFVDLAVLHGPELQLVMRDYPLSAELIKERAAHRARSLQNKSKFWLELEPEDEERWINYGDLEPGDQEDVGSIGSASGAGSAQVSDDGGAPGNGDGGGAGAAGPTSRAECTVGKGSTADGQGLAVDVESGGLREGEPGEQLSNGKSGLPHGQPSVPQPAGSRPSSAHGAQSQGTPSDVPWPAQPSNHQANQRRTAAQRRRSSSVDGDGLGTPDRRSMDPRPQPQSQPNVQHPQLMSPSSAMYRSIPPGGIPPPLGPPPFFKQHSKARRRSISFWLEELPSTPAGPGGISAAAAAAAPGAAAPPQGSTGGAPAAAFASAAEAALLSNPEAIEWIAPPRPVAVGGWASGHTQQRGASRRRSSVESLGSQLGRSGPSQGPNGQQELRATPDAAASGQSLTLVRKLTASSLQSHRASQEGEGGTRQLVSPVSPGRFAAKLSAQLDQAAIVQKANARRLVPRREGTSSQLQEDTAVGRQQNQQQHQMELVTDAARGEEGPSGVAQGAFMRTVSRRPPLPGHSPASAAAAHALAVALSGPSMGESMEQGVRPMTAPQPPAAARLVGVTPPVGRPMSGVSRSGPVAEATEDPAALLQATAAPAAGHAAMLVLQPNWDGGGHAGQQGPGPIGGATGRPPSLHTGPASPFRSGGMGTDHTYAAAQQEEREMLSTDFEWIASPSVRSRRGPDSPSVLQGSSKARRGSAYVGEVPESLRAAISNAFSPIAAGGGGGGGALLPQRGSSRNDLQHAADMTRQHSSRARRSSVCEAGSPGRVRRVSRLGLGEPAGSRATTGTGYGTTHSRRGSANGYVPAGWGYHSRRSSTQGVLQVPADMMLVQKDTWNKLMECITTAAGRLGEFESTVVQLLDIVSQQDEALGRLEQQAQQASASEGGGVLGIMAPDLAKRPASQAQSRIGSSGSLATGGLVGSSTSRLLALAGAGGGGGRGGFSSIVAAAVAAEAAAAGGGSRPGTPNSSMKLESSGATPLQGSGKAGRLAAAAAAAAASGSTGSTSGEALGSFGARAGKPRAPGGWARARLAMSTDATSSASQPSPQPQASFQAANGRQPSVSSPQRPRGVLKSALKSSTEG